MGEAPISDVKVKKGDSSGAFSAKKKRDEKEGKGKGENGKEKALTENSTSRGSFVHRKKNQRKTREPETKKPNKSERKKKRESKEETNLPYRVGRSGFGTCSGVIGVVEAAGSVRGSGRFVGGAGRGGAAEREGGSWASSSRFLEVLDTSGGVGGVVLSRARKPPEPLLRRSALAGEPHQHVGRHEIGLQRLFDPAV